MQGNECKNWLKGWALTIKKSVLLVSSQFVAVSSLNIDYQLVAHYTKKKQQYMAENV